MTEIVKTEAGVFAIIGDEVLPVTNFMDEDGEDSDFEHATVVVAGPDADGMWVTIELDPESGQETYH